MSLILTMCVSGMPVRVLLCAHVYNDELHVFSADYVINLRHCTQAVWIGGMSQSQLSCHSHNYLVTVTTIFLSQSQLSSCHSQDYLLVTVTTILSQSQLSNHSHNYLLVTVTTIFLSQSKLSSYKSHNYLITVTTIL